VIWQELQDQDDATPIPFIRTASLDPDDLYQDFCTGNGTLEYAEVSSKTCPDTNGGTLLKKYLNRADVQSAIFAKSTDWSMCSNKIDYRQSGASMVPYYEKFFVQKPGISILVYSGDVDIMTVPFAITQPCLAEMERTAVTQWGPWYVNGWTAGYFQQFDTYTYATVKGAGHEVPGYQPLNAYNMFSRFLTTQTLATDKKDQFSPSWKKIAGSRSLKQKDMLRRITRF